MGRRCFAKKAILFLYGQWYNSLRKTAERSCVCLGQVQEAVQNQRVPEPGNRVMPLPGMEERLWTAGDTKQNRCGFSAWQVSRAW